MTMNLRHALLTDVMAVPGNKTLHPEAPTSMIVDGLSFVKTIKRRMPKKPSSDLIFVGKRRREQI